MKLLIAIPALDEEESIEAIIERTLAARDYIVAHSPVTEVLITVVSDGSTDRTVERATPYVGAINLIVFPKNKGYGAAIKEAWSRSDAELVGFLDADGTCDPKFFAPLCAAAESQGVDVVLGCRLNKDSQMPPIRRVGNFLFATALSLFSSSRVRDTASGMRVIRRSSLPDLFPLPDGLHFTPAMSARALLSERLKIVEIDMPYHERAGESKLRVAKDGLRFLRVILEAAFLYRPSRPLSLAAAVLVAVAALLMGAPIVYYLQHRLVQEWMIYRFLVSNLFGITACLCFSASYLTGRIAEIALDGESGDGRHTWTARFFKGRWFWLAPASLFFAGGLLVLASFLELLSTGQTYEHWSRYVVMSFCFAVAIILSGTRMVDRILSLLADRLEYFRMHQVSQSGSQVARPTRRYTASTR
jgi:glycosyltransferase involved in cell wall biosynthesis